MVVAHSKGLPFTTIANLQYYSADAPDVVMLVRRDSTIYAAKDLVGKTIGVISLQDFTTLTIKAWLEQNAIDSSTIKFLEIPNSASGAAMEQGRIDAAMAYEPTLSNTMATGKFRILGAPYSALGKRFAAIVLFADTHWIADHRDAVLKFNRATRDAAAYIASHEAETKPLIAQFAGYDAATLSYLHTPTRGLTLDAADLQPTIDAAAKFKLIPKAFPASEMICDCAISAGR